MGLKTGAKSGKGGKSNGKLGGGKLQQPNVESGSDDELQEDTSVLRQSIDLSVKRLSDLLKIFANGTAEIRSMLDHQCDIIYECKVCKSLFRSLANFLSHKRVYCTREYCAAEYTRSRNDVVEDYTWIIQPEPAPASPPKPQTWITSDVMTTADVPNGQISTTVPPISTYTKPKKDLCKIIEKLGKRQSVQTVTETIGHLSATHLYEDVSKKVLERNTDRKEHTIQLESMETTKVGVFQTKLNSTTTTTTSTVETENIDLMKAQISELQSFDSDLEATLDLNGRVVMINSTPRGGSIGGLTAASGSGEIKQDHVCQQCNQKFSTRKTLSHHVKSLHVKFRICYPCPCCKNVFVNPWSVHRHLIKIHRKTNAQVRKLRPQILKKAFRMDLSEESAEPGKVKIKNATQKELERLDQDWMNSFEDDQELQRCGGCGRRFERRAALTSHSQICQKRIAARNSVKQPGRLIGGGPNALVNLGRESGEPPKKLEGISFPAKNSILPIQTENSNSSSSLPAPRTSALQCGGGATSSESTKKDVPAKRIEIQIRKNYIKMDSSGSSHTSDALSESSSRPQSCVAVEGTEDLEEWGINKYESVPYPSEEGRNSSKDPTPRLCENSTEEIPVDGDCEIICQVNKSEVFVRDSVDSKTGSLSSKTKCLLGPIKIESSEQTSAPLGKPSEIVTLCTAPSSSAGEQIIPVENLTNVRSRRKRPASDIVRHLSHFNATDQGSERENVLPNNTGKFSPVKKPKTVEEMSPVMESKMQELINYRRLQCLLCQKKFNKMPNLRRHVALHMGWNRYRCVLCNFKCFSKYDCVAHVCKIHLKNGNRLKALTMVQYIEAQAQEVEASPQNLALLRRSVAKFKEENDADDSEVLFVGEIRKMGVNGQSSKISDLMASNTSVSNTRDLLGVQLDASSEVSKFEGQRLNGNGAEKTDVRLYADEELPVSPAASEGNQESSSLNEPLCNGDVKGTSGDVADSDDACSIIEVPVTSRVQDPSDVKKMVMEVIFGSESDIGSVTAPISFSDLPNGMNSDTLSTRTSSAASSERDQSSEPPTLSSSPAEGLSPVKAERRERPVRNRVKVARDDFIYDLSDACLNPKKEPDSPSKLTARRKQCDSVKDSLKPGGLEHTSIANNFEVVKCIPKLMLVRMDGAESSLGKKVNIGTKTVWSTCSSTLESSKKEVSNTAPPSGGHSITTRGKSQCMFDPKLIQAGEAAKNN